MTDTSRIGAALERPGLDTRTWSTLAVVNTVVVTDEGQICDVTTISGIEETAVAAPPYGGAGYGLHLPIEEGSMVLVEFPEGEFATGGRIVAHIQDKGSPPPQVAQDKPEDVALVVRPGQTVRVIVSRGGSVVIHAEDDGRILLGNEAAELGVARQTDQIALTWSRIQTILDARYVQLPPPLPPLSNDLEVVAAITPDADGAISTSSDKVRST